MKKRCVCRSAGKVYLLLEDTCFEHGVPQACAHLDANAIPCDLYAGPAACQAVLVLPYLAHKTLRVELTANSNTLWTGLVNFDQVKLQSVLAYRTKPELCAAIRDYDLDFVAECYRPVFDHGFQGPQDDIWRIRIDWMGDSAARPELRVLDEYGMPLAATIHLFEFQPHIVNEHQVEINRLYVSVIPEGSPRTFMVVAHDAQQRYADGFCSLDGSFFNALRGTSDEDMKDACADDEAYHRWFDLNRAHAGTLEAQRRACQEADQDTLPLISIVVPCWHSSPKYLGALVDSVMVQSYPCWELLLVDSTPDDGVVAAQCVRVHDGRVKRVEVNSAHTSIVANTNVGIAVARGSLIAFADHDDLLEPDALYTYAHESLKYPDAAVFYCDEDHLQEDGRVCQPVFKSALDVDLLYSYNCVTHFLVVRSELLQHIGVCQEDVSGAQDYDLTLRALAAGAQFHHIARVLYHWRIHEGSTSNDSSESKPYAQTAGRLALEHHMAARNIAATVEETAEPFVYRVRYKLPEPHPLLSIVIPSRDHADVLRACVTSIFEKATYDAFEIVVVENNSEKPETFAFYDELKQTYQDRVQVVTWQGSGFNYSALINTGVAASHGEYLLLLNNDTELISPDALEEMMGYLQRPEVGVVGAKLYFRDMLTQHIGMIIGPGQTCSHVNQNFIPQRGGYRGRAIRPSNYSSVTGACQMVRREVFDEIGGYNETFAVGFNDVDFCLRAGKAGYRVVCTPYAEWYHYEFTSRGREVVNDNKFRRWKHEQGLFIESWPEIFTQGDPYSNPAFDPESTYFALRSM